MSSIAISSIGTKVSYAFESTAGTMPTTGYVVIPEIKSIPDLNPQPDTLDTTTLANTTYKTSITGLKDLGGVIDFNANFTQNLFDTYETSTTGIMDAWATAKAAGKAMYLCVDIAGIDKACFISVEPSGLGLPSGEVNSVYEITLHFTPVGEPSWGTKPTYAA